MSHTLSIQGSPPLPMCKPACIAELADLTRSARAAGEGLYPVGGGTQLDHGLPPSKPGKVVDMTGFAGIVDYPSRDMTITVGTGITIQALRDTLAAEGQWLPIDVGVPRRSTLGGCLAVNTSGPRRYAYGTLRDYLLGISFMTDGGEVINGGGRVVKNVAGYDLMKLQIGALGTLGILTLATLKVKPIPEAAALIVFACAAGKLGQILEILHASRTRPSAIEILNNTAAMAMGWVEGIGCWRVAVLYEEKATTVDWQVETLRAELAGSATETALLDSTTARAVLDKLTGVQQQGQTRARLTVRKSQIASLCGYLDNLLPAAAIFAHGGNGLAIVQWPAEVADRPQGSDALRQHVGQLGGHMQIFGMGVIADWNLPAETLRIMKHLKRTIDTDEVFNAGRLFPVI